MPENMVVLQNLPSSTCTQSPQRWLLLDCICHLTMCIWFFFLHYFSIYSDEVLYYVVPCTWMQHMQLFSEKTRNGSYRENTCCWLIKLQVSAGSTSDFISPGLHNLAAQLFFFFPIHALIQLCQSRHLVDSVCHETAAGAKCCGGEGRGAWFVFFSTSAAQSFPFNVRSQVWQEFEARAITSWLEVQPDLDGRQRRERKQLGCGRKCRGKLMTQHGNR